MLILNFFSSLLIMFKTRQGSEFGLTVETLLGEGSHSDATPAADTTNKNSGDCALSSSPAVGTTSDNTFVEALAFNGPLERAMFAAILKSSSAADYFVFKPVMEKYIEQKGLRPAVDFIKADAKGGYQLLLGINLSEHKYRDNRVLFDVLDRLHCSASRFSVTPKIAALHMTPSGDFDAVALSTYLDFY